MLDVGWDAYGHVANCLSCQMKAFANALPDPLRPRERQVFEQMHLPQSHFGGLPLILLADRFDFCSLAIGGVVEDPGDRDKIATLHRMLDNYATLARERRKVDNHSNRPTVSLDPAVHTTETARTDLRLSRNSTSTPLPSWLSRTESAARVRPEMTLSGRRPSARTTTS